MRLEKIVEIKIIVFTDVIVIIVTEPRYCY